ncbi:MAG TPA: zf-HC2 domain-containing protein [Vulgatibacter sp.]|nr:zf-HC2 domain-containing protein [Vulgatibacter sp.]
MCPSDETLSAWLDGEVESGEEGAVRVHLEACGACRTRADRFDALDRGLRSLPLVAEPPAPSLAGTLRGLSAAGRGSWWSAGAWRTAAKASAAAAAALVVVVAALVTEPGTASPARALADEAVSNHLRALSTGDGTGCQVASEDPGTIAAWIAEAMGREVEVPRLAGATLVGARRCSLLGEETAAIVYRAGETAFSIYLPPEGSAAAAACDGTGRCMERDGQTVCVLPDPGGAPMLMVGALPGHELCSVAASG